MTTETANVATDTPYEAPWAAATEAIEGSLSPSTEEARRRDWKLFTGWCAKVGACPLPAEPDTVIAFIDAMAESRAAASIRRYVTSIASAHRAHGIENAVRTETVRQALRRMHRIKGRRQAQAKGLNWPLVERMLAVGGDSLIETRNRAMLSAAYDGLFRRSELCALRIEDLTVAQNGAATVLVRQSKTDQDGEGKEQWLAPDTTALVQKWIALTGLQEGPIFRAVRYNRQVGGPLRPKSVARIFKQMARASGLPAHVAKRVSGHSTRVGCVQDMVASGIELPAIMHAGRWKSEGSVMRYADRMMAHRSGAAQLAAIQRRLQC